MAVDSEANRESYVGNASTSTPYVINFRFDAASWLRVSVTAEDGEVTELTNGVDFTLDGDGSAGEAELTTAVAVPVTSTVVIAREAPATQSLELVPNAPLSAATLELALDRLIMAIQDRNPFPGLAGVRGLNFPPAEPAGFSTSLPVAALRKARFFWGDAATGEMVLASVDDLAPLFLAHYGGAPTSQDVLAAISALAPLFRNAPPTVSTPGQPGQAAIVRAVNTVTFSEEEPFVESAINEFVGLPLLEVGIVDGYPMVSTDGLDVAASGDRIYIKAQLNIAEGEIRWLIGGVHNGIPNYGFWSDDFPSSPALVTNWTATGFGATGEVEEVSVAARQLYYNFSETATPNWQRVLTYADMLSLPTVDPEVAGRPFLDGTTLGVSRGPNLISKKVIELVVPASASEDFEFLPADLGIQGTTYKSARVRFIWQGGRCFYEFMTYLRPSGNIWNNGTMEALHGLTDTLVTVAVPDWADADPITVTIENDVPSEVTVIMLVDFIPDPT